MNKLLLNAGWASDVGKARRDNQDRVLFRPEEGLFAVADGMGGLPKGKEAAEMACALAAEYLLPLSAGEQEADALADRVQEAVEAVNNEICAMGNPAGQPPAYGSTLCGVLLYGEEAILFNVGDSRVYLLRRQENLAQLTVDHSLAQVLLDNGEISAEEANTHPGRSRLTRFMGMQGRVNADVFRCPLENGDRLLLCSDGLYNMVPSRVLEDVLEDPGTADGLCQRLVKLANDAGGRDNITVICLQVRKREALAPKEEMK